MTDLEFPAVSAARDPGAGIPNRFYILVLSSIAVLAAAVLVTVGSDEQALLTPFTAVCLIVAGVLLEIRAQDGRVAAFDVGTACVVASGLYAGMPLLSFYMTGLSWGPLTGLVDNRLRILNPTPAAWGSFSWGAVIYVASLGVSYAVFRRGAVPLRVPVSRPTSSDAAAIVGCFIGARLILTVIELAAGITLDPSYMDYADAMARRMQLPYWSQQFVNVVVNIASTLRFFVAALAFSRWQRRPWRVVFYMWITGEIIATSLRMGARNNTVLLLVASLILYDRMVRPVPVRRMILIGSAVIVGFMLLGMMRSTQGDIEVFFTNADAFWSGMSEFPAIATTAFDLAIRRQGNVLGHVPWQAQFGEFFALIPSQLLPFQKMDLSLWYVGVVGDTGTGYMFGVIAQSVIGWGWPELILRGIGLGWVLGLFHRAYSKRQGSYTWTMLYTFVAVWSFYTYRSNTLSPIVMIAYWFMPAALIVKFASPVFGRARRLIG